jgi:hypothetical protein
MTKNYKLEFYEPLTEAEAKYPTYVGETDFYFGSLAAIYDTFTPEVIGCKVRNLWNVGVARGVEYRGAKCRITSIRVYHKQTERGKRK